MLSSKKIPLEFQNNPQKFKKFHKIKKEKLIKFSTRKNNVISFIVRAIKFMPAKQLLSILKIIKPALKSISRRTRLNILNWPVSILTRKPKDIRMGRGKGVPTDRVAIVADTPLLNILKAPHYAATKLLFRCAPKIHKSKHLKTDKW